MDYVKALEFVYRLKKKSLPAVGLYYGESKIGRKNYKYTVFGNNEKPAIIFFHGITPSGHNDTRVINFCSKLASVGYKVIVPNIESIQNGEIKPEQVKEFTAIIDHFSQENPVSICASSFSGFISILAASNKKVADKVTSICSVGTYGDIEMCLDYIVKTEPTGIATLAIIKNFIKINKEVSEAINIAIEDTARDNKLVHKYLSNMSEKNREKFVQLTSFVVHRKTEWENRVNKIKLEEIQTTLNDFESLKNLKARILLIHGENDHLIPAVHSIILEKELKERQKDVKLCITPLLTHIQQQSDFYLFSNSKKVKELIESFAYFFDGIKK